MKIQISDWIPAPEDAKLHLHKHTLASKNRIKRATFQKMHAAPETEPVGRRVFKTGLVAAALVAVLCVVAAAVTITKWSGFAFTGGMQETQKQELLEGASLGTAEGYEEADGTMHYLDEAGNEVLVLSAEEARAYERAQRELAEQAVCASTELVDLSTLEMLPSGVTEVPVAQDERVPEFAIGNGHMALFYPAESDGFTLSAGDRVTLSLEANESCILTIGYFRDGVYETAQTENMQKHSQVFEIEEDGVYCFFVAYYSAGASTFTNGVITVEQHE